MMDDYAPYLIDAKQQLAHATLMLAQSGTHYDMCLSNGDKYSDLAIIHLRAAISALLNAERAIMKAAGMPMAGAK